MAWQQPGCLADKQETPWKAAKPRKQASEMQQEEEEEEEVTRSGQRPLGTALSASG